MTKKQKRMLIRIVLSFALCGVFSVVQVDGTVRFILFLIPYFIAGYDILLDAVRGIYNKQAFDENFLMTVATVGAFFLGEYAEGVFVMVFYQTGELFQSYAVGKSRKNISSLMEIRPDYANIEDSDGKITKVDPYDVTVGEYIYIMPGEKIPLDGVICEGTSMLDTVALTGESIPRSVGVSDEVLSGCINLNGMLKIKVTKAFEDSTASKILDLVENATSRKAKSEKFISKFASVYTPFVCLLALALAVAPPVITLLLNGNNSFGTWIYRALTFLVISCPCALVVSVPLSFFASIGGAGKKGILIKGANYLEALSKAKIAVFDKTGTLTKGVFVVTEILPNNFSESMLIEYAALAECYSTHPVSESLKKSYKKTLDKSRVSCFTEMSGLGVSANVDNVCVLVGNKRLMDKYGVDFTECNKPGNILYIAIDGQYSGCIVISDAVKESSAEAVDLLRAIGVKTCVMLTGDRREIGEHVAEMVGIDAVYTELLPAQKVSEVERLIEAKKQKETLIFVGDGINDAPVLARADVGIAMGALGADAAIEAADVVIMDDDPKKISDAISIAKKCMRIVYQNIYFAIGVKVLFLILSAFGITNMWFAIFADVGVMVLAVLNSIRAIKV